LKLHKIEEDNLREFEHVLISKEEEIHDFLEKHPTILEKNLFIIGREVETEDRKFIDLLGIDKDGNVAIIELKKENSRKAIGQILEYAQWVSEHVDSDKLNQIAKRKHLEGYRDLWKKFEDKFGQIPEGFNDSQRLYIVDQTIDPMTEKLARYLRKNGIDIHCIEIKFFESKGEKMAGVDFVVGHEKPQRVTREEKDDDVEIDWNHYSENKGWDDKEIECIQQLSEKILNHSREENWGLSLKLNSKYVAIKKDSRQVVMMRDQKGKIKLGFAWLKDPKKKPEGDLDFKFYEPKNYWYALLDFENPPEFSEIKNAVEQANQASATK